VSSANIISADNQPVVIWRQAIDSMDKYSTVMLGVYLVSAQMFTCVVSQSFNRILGKIGRVASEHVEVELLKTKMMFIPVLTYGLEVCSLSIAQIRSLGYAVSSLLQENI